MLVLTRRPTEKIVLPGLGVTVKVLAIQGGVVRIGVEAPPEVKVARQELLDPSRATATPGTRRLVDGLPDVPRVQQPEQASTNTERIDLARLARMVAEDHRPVIEQGGLNLDLDVAEVPLWVEGDPARLTQVLGNLLHNAVWLTSPGGRVSVRLSAESGQGQVMLVVHGSGGPGQGAEFVVRLTLQPAAGTPYRGVE